MVRLACVIYLVWLKAKTVVYLVMIELTTLLESLRNSLHKKVLLFFVCLFFVLFICLFLNEGGYLLKSKTECWLISPSGFICVNEIEIYTVEGYFYIYNDSYISFIRDSNISV